MNVLISKCYELLNFHLVFGSSGYLGNFHLAMNFAYGNPTLMMALRPIMFNQSKRRGISPEQYAVYTEGVKDVS